nr:GtrA family protein [Caulobacter sp. RHG1]
MSVAAMLTPARRDFLLSALRYGLAGVINTLVGFSIIIALDVGLGLDAHLANAVGYAVGICVSFALSKLFVFKDRQTKARAPLRYLTAVALAFAINQGVLTLARFVVPPGAVFDVAAQGAAVVSYTATLFLLSHFWVFAHQPDA